MSKISKFFKDNFKYFIVIGAIAIVAGLGSLFVNLGMDWFDKLLKPTKFIPSVAIPIIWGIIYLSFAVIFCLWVKNHQLKTSTFVFLVLNGIFNVLWCLLFFTANNTLLGIIVLIVNLILAILLIIDIYKQSPIYAYVLSIYPYWLCLATCLNLAVWILN